MNSPARLTDARRVIAPLTRLETVFDDLSHPEPGVAESSRLRLTAAGGEGPVATLDGIQVHTARRLVVVEHLEIAGDQVARLIDATRPFLSAESPSWTAFGSQAATITPPPGSDLKPVQFRKLRVHRAATSEQDDAERWQAVIIEGRQGNRVEFSVRRVEDGVFESSLDTTRAPLPVWLALRETPLAGLAPAALFQGVVHWTCSPGGCSGAIRGTLVDLDLSDLLPADSIHRALGEVRVEIEHLEFDGPSITTLAGTMHSPGGVVSRSLMMAAADYLYCKLPREPRDDLQAYDRLGIRFELDHRGLTLTSAMPANPEADSTDVKATRKLPAGCLVTRGREAALIAPSHPQLPVTFLAQFACGIRHHWELLPATAGAVELFSIMPPTRLPESVDASVTSPVSQ